MARVGKLVLPLDSVLASVRSVLDVLTTSHGVAKGLVDRFPDFFERGSAGDVIDIRADAPDFILAEPINVSASGARKLSFQPSDRYLELAAAVAGDGDRVCALDVHGWPILSKNDGGSPRPATASTDRPEVAAAA